MLQDSLILLLLKASPTRKSINAAVHITSCYLVDSGQLEAPRICQVQSQ